MHILSQGQNSTTNLPEQEIICLVLCLKRQKKANSSINKTFGKHEIFETYKERKREGKHSMPEISNVHACQERNAIAESAHSLLLLKIRMTCSKVSEPKERQTDRSHIYKFCNMMF